jgi:hypothetical protein
MTGSERSGEAGMTENPLGPLRDDAAPGTRLTADGLVAAGRRRVRRRRRALAGAAAALVLVVTVGAAAVAGTPIRPAPTRPTDPMPTVTRPAPPSPSASPSATPGCHVYLLIMPDRVRIEKVVVDATGRWAAGLRADWRLVIWHDNEVVGVVRDVLVNHLAGISSDGVAAGAGQVDGKGWMRAMTFQGDRAVVLPSPGENGNTRVWGTNAGGDVVGTADLAGGRQRAVLWPRSDPSRPQVLPTPGGRNSAAYAIARDGTVVGMLGSPATDQRPYIWRPDGTGVQLPLPAGATDGQVDDVAGAWAADFDNRVRWRLSDPGTPASKPLPEVTGAGPRDLAEDGSVLFGGNKRALVWGAGGPQELPLATGFPFALAVSINADATVVGGVATTLYAHGGAPFLWRCTW